MSTKGEKQTMKIAKTVFSKTMWMARGTATMMGLAVILAVVLGVATTALGANGKPFLLGKPNVANAVSKLIKKGPGPALDLRVGSGPPLRVNSSAKIANLNADRVDGKDSTHLGVNGLERVLAQSAFNSDSPKIVTAVCPVGKVVVGTGANVAGGKSGAPPNAETNVVIDDIDPEVNTVQVWAYEEGPIGDNWGVDATAICATAP